MSISLTIPTYNGINFLKLNLPIITKLSLDEIIIVDDSSTDNTVDYIRNHYPQIKLNTHSINQRFPQTANDCLNLASSEIVILLNQDAIPNLNIPHLIQHFNSDPKLFAITFNDNHNSYAQGKYHKGFIEFNNGKITNNTHASLWASGGASAFRKSIWTELNGFDTVYTPGYFEDFDLGLRSWNKGYHILWCRQCQVIHDHPSSTFTKSFNQTSLSQFQYRNYLLAHLKNLDYSHLPKFILNLMFKSITHPKLTSQIISAITKSFQASSSQRFNPQQLIKQVNLFDTTYQHQST